jgi:hypothetical protein
LHANAQAYAGSTDTLHELIAEFLVSFALLAKAGCQQAAALHLLIEGERPREIRNDDTNVVERKVAIIRLARSARSTAPSDSRWIDRKSLLALRDVGPECLRVEHAGGAYYHVMTRRHGCKEILGMRIGAFSDMRARTTATNLWIAECLAVIIRREDAS